MKSFKWKVTCAPPGQGLVHAEVVASMVSISDGSFTATFYQNAKNGEIGMLAIYNHVVSVVRGETVEV